MDMTNSLASASKMTADLGLVKWLLAAIAIAVDFVLPTSMVKDAAIGAAALIAFDTITGLYAAWQTGTVSSKKFSRLLGKILGYASVLTVVAVVSKFVPGMAEYAGLGATGILTMVILTEGISVLENVVRIGVPLPFGLTEMLKKRLGEQNERSNQAPDQ